MITGFNNDIKHGGNVFHVQTEDKGEPSSWIESLIYVGGKILARKRMTYKQLLEEGADKPAIAKLMERQHRLMIEQIREGRFDGEGLKGAEPPAPGQPRRQDDSEIVTARMRLQAKTLFDQAAAAAEEPKVERESAAERPAESGPAPTLDKVIFDYLSTVAREESLVLLMDESPALASATTTRIDLGTHASRSGKPIGEAAIAVRMISKTGGPVTLAQGTTDAEGTLQLVVEVPEVA
ncbi:MAG: hypothetical protein O7A04_04395, partial [Acidobacteria bacterium]|nr:hypothetical protein [Acidobacteriota bacterium]